MVLVCWLHAQGAADMVTFAITVPNSQLSSFPGPYGKVVVTADGTGPAKITLAQVDPSSPYFFFDSHVFAINPSLDATVSFLTWTAKPGDTKIPHVTQVAAGNVSEFGDFPIVFKNFDGPHAGVISISFTLTPISGSFADAASVLETNSKGYLAAAHIYPQDGSLTGFAGAAPITTGGAPIPGALVLLGAGLVRLVAYSRRKRSRA
jgi:hypothetical protein